MAEDAKKGAAKPPPPKASCVFLVGSRGPTAKDDFLDQASTWVSAIAAKVGKGTAKAALGPPAQVAATIDQLSARMATEGALTDAVLDAHLGSLRGHTLIFVTHGLDVDETLGPDDRKASEGLLFHNPSTGRSAADLIMTRRHLDNMAVGTNNDVVARPGLLPGDPMTQQINDYARVLTAIRRSVFASIYLAACGGSSRLGAFSFRLQLLTERTLFFNDENINLPTKPTKPYAEVGSIWPSDNKFHITKGFPPYAPRVQANRIDLVSKTDTFLPGSLERLP